MPVKKLMGLRSSLMAMMSALPFAAIDKARLDGGRAAFLSCDHWQDAVDILQRHGQIVSGFGQARQCGAANLIARRQLGRQALR
jgi:hypothetical protein